MRSTRSTAMRRATRPRGHGAIRVAVAVAVLFASLAAGAPGAPVTSVGAAADRDGRTSSSAAASCWAIKQQFPASTDGVYWLQTPALVVPQAFHCDMTTDGGGWVLIARGRDGWTFAEQGQGDAADIRTVTGGPGAFVPEALSTDTINGLLGNAPVTSLTDGVRLRRAANTAGTQWQEIRWRLLDLQGWSWAFDGGHRLAGASIDAFSYTGGNTFDSTTLVSGEVGTGNRGADNLQRWFTSAWSGNASKKGFAIGGITGLTSASSYLWSPSNGIATPLAFTQVFIRPRTMSYTYDPLPDTGLPAVLGPGTMSDQPVPLAAGVSGVLKAGDTPAQELLDTPVQALAQWGDRIFVGGKFSQVNRADGTTVNQSYLAAFDRATGAYIDSFTPQLDGTVWDLVVANDRLYVGGQFTKVNGLDVQALVALDPTTGARITDFDPQIHLTAGNTVRAYVRSLDVDGPWLYLGGNFSRGRNAGNTEVSLGRLAKADLNTGFVDTTGVGKTTSFRPNMGGSVFDVDAVGSRVYAVGDFTTVGTAPDITSRVGSVVLDSTTGQVIDGTQQYVRSTAIAARQYQQAVLAVGDEVWQGGSEHNTQVYRANDYQLLRSYITGDIGGDNQALATTGGVVYAASHSNQWIYWDTTVWDNSAHDGYSRVDQTQWVQAFDAASRSFVTSWVPDLVSATGEGTWELFVDSTGCLWFGGDFSAGPPVNGSRQFLRGVGKFCPLERTPPPTPTNVVVGQSAGGVRLTWNAVVDDRPGAVRYEVIRNDRVVSPSLTTPTFFDPTGSPTDRYVVRAVDQAANRSESSAVQRASGTVLDGAPSAFTARTPVRILDTRPASRVGFDGAAPTACLAIRVPVRGVNGVPSDASAVAVQLTAAEGSAVGFVSAVPTGAELGLTSNVNLDTPGEAIANLAVVPVGSDGSITVYTQAATHAIVDLVGWWVPAEGEVSRAGRYVGVGPNRILDTRPDSRVGWDGPTPTAGSTVTVQVTGRGGVPPAGVAAVAVNVTVTESTGPGYLQVAPAASLVPGASSTANVNSAGQTIAAATIVPVDANGRIAVFAQTGAHLVIDVTGWFTDSTAESSGSGLFVPAASPTRLLDTRPGGVGATGSRPVPGERRDVTARGSAMVGNLTITNVDRAGFVQLGPTRTLTPGTTSNINATGAFETLANAFIVPADGGVTAYTIIGTDLIVDTSGYMTP
jgi:hypothetical protein